MAEHRFPLVARGTVLAPLTLGAALIVVWALVSAALGPALVPSPLALAERLVAEVDDGDILAAAAETFGVSALGCLLGLVVALPLGYLLAHSDTATAALGPYLAASQAIPAVAFAPLLVLWFGYGALPKAVLCALLVFFPILLNTVLGLSTLDRDVVDAARVDGAGPGRLLVHIETPMALPAVLTGIRNGFVLSVTGAVVGEFVMGGAGLGELLSVFRDRVDTTGMVATLFVLAALAVAINLAVRGLERMVRWW
ncbi:ABC transporter permease [Pseudactinotalea sp.]|uniref:ABC transporter permease n=1 Tax=Pseudactinotalea sp. TaxID=1926260 RepID=UPI003B3A2EB9